MRGGGFTPEILAGLALLSASCDPPLCRSEVALSFTTTGISGDVDDFAPGVQANIELQTTLLPGDVVTLDVLDDTGARLVQMSRTVEMSGDARFAYVTLPSPHAVLRASGRGVCGAAHVEIMIDVPAEPSCRLAVTPAPESAAYYAPFGVLSLRSDPDPVTPGYQTMVHVASLPGWSVEVLQRPGGAAAETEVGRFIADGDGATRAPVTLPDGWVTLRAVCRGGEREVRSPQVTLLADTTAPGCLLVAPPPGSTITRDNDQDPSDGVQFSIAGRSPDADVGGEPVDVILRDNRGIAVSTAAIIADPFGNASDEMTVMPAVMPARYSAAFTMHDHAGNACTAVTSYSVSL